MRRMLPLLLAPLCAAAPAAPPGLSLSDLERPGCHAYQPTTWALACSRYEHSEAGVDEASNRALDLVRPGQPPESLPTLVAERGVFKPHKPPARTYYLDELRARLAADGFVLGLPRPVALRPGRWKRVPGVELPVRIERWEVHGRDGTIAVYRLQVRCPGGEVEQVWKEEWQFWKKYFLQATPHPRRVALVLGAFAFDEGIADTTSEARAVSLEAACQGV